MKYTLGKEDTKCMLQIICDGDIQPNLFISSSFYLLTEDCYALNQSTSGDTTLFYHRDQIAHQSDFVICIAVGGSIPLVFHYWYAVFKSTK